MIELLLLILVLIPIIYWADSFFFSNKKDEISAPISKPKLKKFSNQSIPDEIRKYKVLLDKGVINKDEYQKLKNELLE